MFTQRLSMDCTKEQYEEYLKEELLKMGYKLDYRFYWDFEQNQFIEINGEYVGTVHKDNLEKDRTYLGSFNAPLFLALAAMTDRAEGNYGEYVIGVNSGRLYKMQEGDKILLEYKAIRKATKEEIMAKFGENKTENGKEIAEKLCNDINRLQREVVNSYIGQTINQTKELEAISLLKSKGYKILKPKTWEEV